MIIPDGVYDLKNSKGQSLWVYGRWKQPFFKDDTDNTSCTNLDIFKAYLIVIRNTCFTDKEIYTFQWVFKTDADKNPPELNEVLIPNVFSIRPDDMMCTAANLDPYFSFQNTSVVNTEKKVYQTQIICPPMAIKPCSCIPKGFVVDKGTYISSEEGTDPIFPPCSLPWARTANSNVEMFTLTWVMDLTERFWQVYKEYYGLQPPECFDSPTTYWRNFEGNCIQTGCGTTPDENCKYADMCTCLEDNGIHDNPTCLALSQQKNLSWWIWLLIAIGIILVVTAILFTWVVMARKSKTRRR